MDLRIELLQFYENECANIQPKQEERSSLSLDENEIQNFSHEWITQPDEILKSEVPFPRRQLPNYWRDRHEIMNESLHQTINRQRSKHLFQQHQQEDQSTTEFERERREENGIDVLLRTPYVLLPEPIRRGRVIAFDLETTGFSTNDSIVEFGAVEIIDCVRTGLLFQSYAQPRTEIDPRAEALHGLNRTKLQKALPIQIVLASFLAWVGSSPLVAHNAVFDCRFLFVEMSRLNLTFAKEMQVFCTQTYFRRKYPGRSYGLNDVALFLGLKVEERILHHTALVDAELLANVYIRLATESNSSEGKQTE